MTLSAKQANQVIASSILGDETYRATGTGAVSETIAVDRNTRILSIQLHLGAAGASGLFSVTLGSAAGTEYDTVLLAQEMNGISDVHITDAFFVAKDDNVILTYPNNTATFGLTVLYANG